MKACAKAVATTDGDVFARLVVIFLKRTFRCIRAARVGALLPMREIRPDGRSSISLPLLLTVSGVSSTCLKGRKEVTDKDTSNNERIEASVEDLQCSRGLCT